MNALAPAPRNKVSLSDLPVTRLTRRVSSGVPYHVQRDMAAANVLRAQSSVRILVAASATAIELLLLVALGSRGSVTGLTAALVAYIGFVALMHAAVARRFSASPAFVTVSLLGDMAFVYATTLAATAHPHYERALLGAMLVVHVANFYYGRRQAWRIALAGVAGYVLLVLGGSRSLTADRVEELWSLAIGCAGTVLVIAQAAGVRRRLRAMVTLFERAEEGDFSQAYDEAADLRPDAITRVGHAYNRVRSQLASMVLTDPLTGCLNRRGFDQALVREVARSARAHGEISLLTLDLDHFKLVNDTYGHLAGDEVLRAIGALLMQAGRVADVVARVGGEEFSVLLMDTGEPGARLFASRLCERVRAHPFVVSMLPDAIQLTTSIGVVSARPVVGDDGAGQLAMRADAALYAAKRAGRDQVQHWTPELDQAGSIISGEHALAVRARASTSSA